MLNILALIPARMGSTRFPGKPLAPILGTPMIGHVYKSVARATRLDLAAVATCDAEIFDYVESIGGTAVMTGSHHERATDRCAEALLVLEEKNKTRYDVVIMVQGDEPMTHPEMITEVLQPMLEDDSIYLVNLLGAIQEERDFEDQNCVKVVCDLKQNAMYFSREPIPTRWKGNDVPMGKQVAVMAFHRDFLLKYTEMEPTPLEIIESVDMLRVLEHGFKIRMAHTRYNICAVDTPMDLKRVEGLMNTL
jgi:3-deoxy-manno-octulosonate cytidylyltransferase (CMP-KDO synthetase)